MNPAPERMPVTLESFVAEWFADEPPGEPASWGPEPLQLFHRVAAGRDAVYDRSIVIDREPPSGPARADGLVPFGRESEGVFEMLFDPADPVLPVFYDFGVPGRPLMAERAGLGEFLLHRTLAEVTMGRLSAFAFATGDEVRRITAGLTPVPVQPLSYPAPGMRTLIGPDLVVHTGPEEGGDDTHWLFVGVREPSLLDPVRAVGCTWEYIYDPTTD